MSILELNAFRLVRVRLEACPAEAAGFRVATRANSPLPSCKATTCVVANLAIGDIPLVRGSSGTCTPFSLSILKHEGRPRRTGYALCGSCKRVEGSPTRLALLKNTLSGTVFVVFTLFAFSFHKTLAGSANSTFPSLQRNLSEWTFAALDCPLLRACVPRTRRAFILSDVLTRLKGAPIALLAILSVLSVEGLRRANPTLSVIHHRRSFRALATRNGSVRRVRVSGTNEAILPNVFIWLEGIRITYLAAHGTLVIKVSSWRARPALVIFHQRLSLGALNALGCTASRERC